MAKFLYIYHGGSVPQSEEEGARVMKAWMDWFATLGAAGADGGANPTSGYSIVDAKDAADAARMAKGCPILQAGGSVELAPIVQM